MLLELRLAARRLVRDPWATLTAIVTVALGAGVAVAVFAAGYGLLVRPLPYDTEGRLRLLDTRARLDQVEQWRGALRSFERITSYASEGLVLTGLGDARRIRGTYVDDWFFDTLAARPLAGRLPARSEPTEAVISERLVRAAGLSPDTATGTPIEAGGASMTIVGVLPEEFAFPSARTDVWIPARVAKPVPLGRLSDARQFRFAGLIRRGMSDASASAELERVRRELEPQSQPRNAGGPAIQSAHAVVTGDIRSTVVVLAAAAALLWIVTSANLATILVGRTIARRRELAVCRALGAGPARRLSSILSEAAMITTAGTLLGVGLAAAALRAAAVWAHDMNARPGEIRLDGTPLAFAVLAALALAGLATVLALPALQRGAGHLHSPHASVTRRDRRTRALLLVSQVALAVVLVSGGTLLVRTVAGLLRTDLGLDSRNVLVSDLVLTPTTAFQAPARWPMLQDLLDRVRALPGVRFAGAGSSLPPAQEQLEITTNFQGANGEASHNFSAAIVTPGYLDAIGARLLDGRFFGPSDLTGPPTVVLSESAARAAFGSVAVAGRELPFNLPHVNDQRRARVIGVVGDIRYSGLEAAADSAIYVPWHLAPMGQGFLAIETHDGDDAAAVAAIRTIIHELDPTLPHTPMRTFDEIVAQSIGVRRVAAPLAAMFAVLAFAIALVGLAGNVLRSVAERRRELAIRAALGASPPGLVRHVASEVVLLSTAGLVGGVAAALATGGILQNLIAGVRPYDAATLGGVAALVLAASLIASCVPARRAGRIDPSELLRD